MACCVRNYAHGKRLLFVVSGDIHLIAIDASTTGLSFFSATLLSFSEHCHRDAVVVGGQHQQAHSIVIVCATLSVNIAMFPTTWSSVAHYRHCKPECVGFPTAWI